MMEDGLLKFNVSDSLVGSKDIIVSVQDTHSLISLSNDDQGEEDIESNYLELSNYKDMSTGEVVGSGNFLLPANAFRDHQMMDWIFSMKGDGSDSTTNEFNDLMSDKFTLRKEMGVTMNPLKLA